MLDDHDDTRGDCATRRGVGGALASTSLIGPRSPSHEGDHRTNDGADDGALPVNWLDSLTKRVHRIAAPAPSAPPLASHLLDGLIWLSPANASPRAEEAGSFLQTLPAQTLLDIDERVRSWASPVHRDWPADMVAQLTCRDLDPRLRHSLLFLAASHHDGHVREAAVRALGDHPGYLTLAAALIRCTDWVEQVRRTAESVTERLLNSTQGSVVVALWPLVLRLQTRERMSQSWFAARVEAWMLRPPSPWFRQLLDSRHAATRAWAFQRGLEHRIEPGIDLLATAMRDPDPRISLHALRFASRNGDPRTHGLATLGLDAAHPTIRRTSLHLLSELDGGLSRDQLHRRVGDRAAGVRSLAAYLLRERYAEDAAAIWRAALDSAADRAPLGVLSALAEHAQPQDTDRFRRWLADRSSMVRAAALRGLLKAGCAPDDRELAGLLVQGGNRVRWVLHRHVGAGGIALDAPRIARLVADPSLSQQARDEVRDLMFALGHWSSLTQLLHFSDGGEDVLIAWWRDAISTWVRSADAYAPLGAQTGAKLLLALDARRDELSSNDYAIIKSAIERH